MSTDESPMMTTTMTTKSTSADRRTTISTKNVFLSFLPNQQQRQQQQQQTLVFLVPGNPGLIEYYTRFLEGIVDGLQKSDHGGAESAAAAAAAAVVAGLSLGGFEVVDQTITDNDYGGGGGGGGGVSSCSSCNSKKEKEQEEWVKNIQRPVRRSHTGPTSSGHGHGHGHGPRWGNENGLFGLQEQIELCHARVGAIVELMTGRQEQEQEQERVQKEGTAPAEEKEEKEKGGDESVDVILIGHSVGAYIALEVIRLWNEEAADKKQKRRCKWTPRAAMLLMPTLIDLHKSVSGQMATPLLSTLPFVSEIMQLAASGLRVGLGLRPQWLKKLVSLVTGMEESQGPGGGEEGQGLQTTVDFIASARGVKQALHLARDELAQIRAEKWGQQIWGVATKQGQQKQQEQRSSAAKGKNGSANPAESADSTERGSDIISPALYFLFAQHDHWIADETRKEIVEVHAHNARRIVIDQEQGLAHAWPLRSTGPVVKMVLPWIEEVLQQPQQPQQQLKQ